MNRITLPILILALSLAHTFSPAAESNADQAESDCRHRGAAGRATMVDEKSPGKPVVAVDLGGTKVTDAELTASGGNEPVGNAGTLGAPR